MNEHFPKHDKNPQETGWEEVASLANNEPIETTPEEAYKTKYEELKTFQANHHYRSLDTTFRVFYRNGCLDKTPSFVNAAADRMMQLLQNNSPEVELLSKSGRPGFAGTREATPPDKFRIGTGEYIFDVLGAECSPKHIGWLATVMKTIPSSEYAKFENMRIDAYRIEQVVIGHRNFIHDNTPGAYSLIKAMVDYYDSKDDTKLCEQKRKELSELFATLKTTNRTYTYSNHDKYIFDLDNYDKPANDYEGDRIDRSPEHELVYDGDKTNLKAIDILRRLEKNMAPVPLEVPKTTIPELNKALHELGQVPINEKTGEMRIPFKDISNVLSAINSYLVNNQKKRVLLPSTITAIVYVDRLCAASLRSPTRKDHQEIIFDPTFKELLRFSQLTMGDKYSEKEFEQYYSKILHQASEAFGEDSIDNDATSEAFGIIQTQTLRNTKAVADQFSQYTHTEYLTKAIWSGNLTHELIELKELYHKY